VALAVLPITLIPAAGCGDDASTTSDSGKISVVTTLPLFADFVREIGGDRVEVMSLVPAGADPHTWEPAPGDVRRVAEADIAFANGLDLEPAAIEVIETNLPENTDLLAVGEEVARAGAELVASQEQEEGEEHEGEAPSEFEGMNPHLWLNIENAREYARVIRDGLSSADADGAHEYDRNYEAFLAELDEVDAYVREKTDPIEGSSRKLITTHDAFGYFADYFGLEILSFVAQSPGQEPSPEDVANLARDIEREGVPAVFVEPQIEGDGEILQQAAEDAGVEVCTLYSDSLDNRVTSYIELMRFNADELARCLGS
jgi:zinc/manganese transport system substrate-binding protein/manganese/iron transport system substrate-binding protein